MESIWNGHSIKKRIIYLVNYFSVFNDAIRVSEIQRIIDADHYHEGEFQTALRELSGEGLLVLKNGFASIPTLISKIFRKPFDYYISKSIIDKRIKFLYLISRLPFIKFIGISGSVAARNPVESPRRKLDLDIFIITSHERMWVVGLLGAIFNNFGIRKLMNFPYCFNYILDESSMTVPNRNFYTATEIKNVIPLFGYNMYERFLSMNSWVCRYYPHLEKKIALISPAESVKMRIPLNRILFIVFTLFRIIKNLSLRPLLEMSFQYNPMSFANVNSRTLKYGGYQYFVRNKFEKNMKDYFPGYWDKDLILRMFDDILSLSFYRENYYSGVQRFMPDDRSVRELALNTAKYE